MTDKIQNNIVKIINNAAKGVVILYDGCWGIGKTHDWLKTIEPAITKKQKYYVSLFGLKNAAEIKDALLAKYFQSQKETHNCIWPLLLFGFLIFLYAYIHFDIIFNPAKEAWFNYIYNTTLLILFAVVTYLVFTYLWHWLKLAFYRLIGEGSKDILINIFIKSGSVICFDDFERLSSQSARLEALALFNSFSKEKNLKILVLADYFNNSIKSTSQDKTEEDSEIQFENKYKEKVFDYHFFKTPSYNFNKKIEKDLTEFPNARQACIEFFSQLFNKDKKPEKIYHNFRMAEKVLRNIQYIYNIKKNLNFENENIDEKSLTQYIIFVSYAHELGYTKDLSELEASLSAYLYHITKETDLSEELKSIIGILYSTDLSVITYKETAQLILCDTYNEEKLRKELCPSCEEENMSDFEKDLIATNTDEFWTLPHEKIVEQFKKLQKHVKNRTKPIFSSNYDISRGIGKYAFISYFIKSEDDNMKDMAEIINRTIKDLSKEPLEFIEKILQNFIRHPSFGYIFGNEELLQKHAKDFEQKLEKIVYDKLSFDAEKIYDDLNNYDIKTKLIIQAFGNKKTFFEEFSNLYQNGDKNFGLYLKLMRRLTEVLSCVNFITPQEKAKAVNRLKESIETCLKKTPQDAMHDQRMLQQIKNTLKKINS